MYFNNAPKDNPVEVVGILLSESASSQVLDVPSMDTPGLVEINPYSDTDYH